MSGVYQKVWGKLFLGQSFKIFNSSISCFRIPNVGYDLDCPTVFDALRRTNYYRIIQLNYVLEKIPSASILELEKLLPQNFNLTDGDN